MVNFTENPTYQSLYQFVSTFSNSDERTNVGTLKKVKQSRYRPAVAQRVLRKLRFPDFVTTAQDGGRLSVLRTGHLYPQEIHLVLVSVRGWVDPRTIERSEGFYVNEKSTDTSWDFFYIKRDGTGTCATMEQVNASWFVLSDRCS